MFESVKKIFNILIQDKELFTSTAKIYRNMYEALITEGFSDDQAIKIVCSHSVLPTSQGKNKTSVEI